LKKVCYKALCVKTFSGKVVRHSLAYLSVYKWLVGDVASYLEFWAKLTNPGADWPTGKPGDFPVGPCFR